MGNTKSFVKSPAFQFYPADFLADQNTMVMTAAEVGAYLLLLCVCWRENGLPDSLRDLADIARMPLARFTKSWEMRIQRCFIKRTDGMWTHKRLEEERVKQAQNREKRQKAGEKGAGVRWQGDGNASLDSSGPRSADSKAVANNALSSSSSTASSIAAPTKKENKEMVIADEPRSASHKVKLCDEEYVEKLQQSDAYKQLDVRYVLEKMAIWCENTGTQPTRHRLLNWLNREDRPMENKNGTNRPRAQTASARNLQSSLEYLGGLQDDGRQDDSENASGLLPP